jgi:hypothetical protein
VNCDVSFQKTQGWMGFGVVVRDEEGRMVTALSIMHVGFLDPPVAKAWEALIGIKVCKVMHFSNAHFEGDTNCNQGSAFIGGGLEQDGASCR